MSKLHELSFYVSIPRRTFWQWLKREPAHMRISMTTDGYPNIVSLRTYTADINGVMIEERVASTPYVVSPADGIVENTGNSSYVGSDGVIRDAAEKVQEELTAEMVREELAKR